MIILKCLNTNWKYVWSNFTKLRIDKQLRNLLAIFLVGLSRDDVSITRTLGKPLTKLRNYSSVNQDFPRHRKRLDADQLPLSKLSYQCETRGRMTGHHHRQIGLGATHHCSSRLRSWFSWIRRCSEDTWGCYFARLNVGQHSCSLLTMTEGKHKPVLPTCVISKSVYWFQS